MPTKKDVGDWGEDIAVRFLQKKGFKVLLRNWRSGKDEIDIVARDEHVLVFVEVKTRKAGGFTGGLHAIDRRKKKALRRVCYAYLRNLWKKPENYRLDVIDIQYYGFEDYEIYHFPAVPLFP